MCPTVRNHQNLLQFTVEINKRQMARGNRREKAREKKQKGQAQEVRSPRGEAQRQNGRFTALLTVERQKKKNTHSGTEFARIKEDNAAIMRRKQEEGTPRHFACFVAV